jgi:hypothetical protein
MKRNTILQISAVTLKVLRVFTLIGMAASLAALVLHFTNPQLLAGWQQTENRGNLEFSYEISVTGENGETITSPQNNTASVLFNFIKAEAVLLLLALVFSRALRVLQSLKSWETFNEKNVEHFRRVGLYFLLIAPLMTFSYSNFSGTSSVSFNFPFSWLCAALSAFVLAEIFKEGQHLAEEQKLTV